jgi:hypothetical protein
VGVSFLPCFTLWLPALQSKKYCARRYAGFAKRIRLHNLMENQVLGIGIQNSTGIKFCSSLNNKIKIFFILIQYKYFEFMIGVFLQQNILNI